MLKPKYLSTVQSIQILRQGDIMSIDNIKLDLEGNIDIAYQKINFEDPVAIISQIIINRVCHSRHYSLSNYFLKNRHFIIVASFTCLI